MNTNSVISLQFYASPDEVASFLIVEADFIQKENLDLFTPTFMRWKDNLWIFDLKSCRQYWMKQAQLQKLSLPVLIEKFIEDFFVVKKSDDLQKGYRAFLGAHPWPGLLLIALMKERDLQGLLVWDTPYTQSLYRSITWTQWQNEVDHLGFMSPTQKAQSSYKAQLRAFNKAMARLTLKTPWELRQMPAASIQRRYGSLLARAWSWTYPPAPEGADQLSLFDQGTSYPYDLKSFPWTSYQSPEPPLRIRLLEYPVSDWDSIQTLLLEDLDRLLKHPQLSKIARVCEIQWKITLCNFKELIAPVVFHSPHSLHEEEGHHKTSLNQFYYAYERLMKDLKVREEDLDLPLQIPFASWELCISQKFFLAPQAQSFIEAHSGGGTLNQIKEFSNKLPSPLVHYSLHPDFCPEKAFVSDASQSASIDSESWRFAAQKRPFFIYKHAKKLSRKALQGPKFFLERCSNCWWEQGQSSSHSRDYFLIQDLNLQCIWAYRNSEGQWYEHGLYS